MTPLLTKIRDHLYSKKTMFIFEHHLDDFRAMKRAQRSKWKGKLLEEADYPAFTELLAKQNSNETIFRPDFDLDVARERLQKGHLCFICYDRDNIIGYTWYAAHDKYIPELTARILLKEKEIYNYNSYLDKEYRLKTAAWAVVQIAHKYCLDNGFNRVLCATMNWNKPPQNALKRIGYKQNGQVTAGYFLTLRYFINNCPSVRFKNDASTFEMYVKLGKYFRK